jgi:hypothetical protein
MRSLTLSSLLAIAFLVPLQSAGAQAMASIGLRPSSEQLSATATLQPRPAPAAHDAVLLNMDSYKHGSRKEGVALMIVGAAGIVTGLIVDEPIVTILGAGAGGVGLYLYLR